jgi:hypothetical protein
VRERCERERSDQESGDGDGKPSKTKVNFVSVVINKVKMIKEVDLKTEKSSRSDQGSGSEDRKALDGGGGKVLREVVAVSSLRK